MTDSGKFVAHSSRLQAGMTAPYFEGRNEKDETLCLHDFSGKHLLLYFYPKDNTPACTAQACSLKDNFSKLSELGIAVLGISADTINSHVKFSQKQNLPFSLLSDTDLSIIKAYDVWGKKQLYGRIYEGIVRTSFLIDEKAIISHVIRAVDTKNHAQQIIEIYKK